MPAKLAAKLNGLSSEEPGLSLEDRPYGQRTVGIRHSSLCLSLSGGLESEALRRSLETDEKSGGVLRITVAELLRRGDIGPDMMNLA